MMQFQKFNKLTAIWLSIAIPALGVSFESLKSTKQDIIKYSYEKNIQDSNKLKKDWINSIQYKYIYNNGETYNTRRSYISVSQPIFKSGGIYSAIKYASSMEKFSNSNIDIQKQELVKQTMNLLLQLNKIDITIKKQKLLIDNAKLDIERKKEQVLNGILDTSFLDNAILDANSKQNTLIDLQYQKEELIHNLSNLTDQSYDQFTLPVLSIVEKNDFIDNNIYMKKAKDEIDTSYWMKNMITSNYLPTVNLTADYTKYHETDNNPSLPTDGTSNIGFNITIPLDIKYNNNIASSKLDYLKKKVSFEDIKTQEENILKNSLSKIKALDNKIDIAKEDVKLYDSLLTQIVELQNVGMKTQTDVQTMENSRAIKALDIKSLNIDKQLELLEIYSRVDNG